MRRTVHVWVGLVLILLIGRTTLRADPSFRFSLRGDGFVEAEPGSSANPVLKALIESSQLGDDRVGPEAWSMGLRSEGCLFEALAAGADVASVIADRPETDSFVVLEIVENGAGAVAAAILGFSEPVSLDPDASPHHTLTLTMTGRVPEQGGCDSCVVRFENGVQGDGRAVTNLVTYKSLSFPLEDDSLDEATVLLCDDICNRFPPLTVTRDETSSTLELTDSLREACVRLEATPGASVAIELADTAGESSGSALALYASCGSEVDPATARFAAEERGRALQRIVIPAACPTGYTVLALANELVDGAATVSLTVQEVNLAVESVSPRRGARGFPISLTVRGAGFDENSLFLLAHPDGQSEIRPADDGITIVSSRLAELEFDIPAGADLVEYDLVVVDRGDANATPLATLPRAFHVLVDQPGAFLVSLEGHDRIRVSRLTRQTVRYENTGTVEIPAPLLRVTGPKGTRLRLLSDRDFPPIVDSQQKPDELWILGVNEKGVPGKLSPDAVGEVPVELVFDRFQGADGTFALAHFTPNPGDEIDWAAARPMGVDPAVWEETWPKLEDILGSKWGEYVERLAEIATVLGRRGRNPASALDAFRLAVRRARGIPVGGIRGRITNDADFTPLADVLLFAIAENGEVAACAQSSSSGDFAFDGLATGTYTIEARGHRLTQTRREFVVQEGEDLLSIDLLGIDLRAVVDDTQVRRVEECRRSAQDEETEGTVPLALPPPPNELLTEKEGHPVIFIGAWDPNEKRGARNRGGRRRGRRTQLVDPTTDQLEYKIHFENEKAKPGMEENRTAAQRVEIVDELKSSNLDVTTVCFREVRFADTIVHLDKPGLLPLERQPASPSAVFPFTSLCDGLIPGQAEEDNPATAVQAFTTIDTAAGFKTELTIRINHRYLGQEWPLLLWISAEADFEDEELRWVLQTLEPIWSGPPDPRGGLWVGRIPEDPDAGFLLPNELCMVNTNEGEMEVSGRGEGYVSMSIRPKRQVRDKKRIRNRAKIKFDANPDISPEPIPSGYTACRDGAPLPVESPSPSDGAEGVSREGTLRWEPGCRAARFEVFLWPTGDPEPAEGVVTEGLPELPLPADLLPGTAYSWRVVPANEFDETPEDPTGVSTWSFTTGIDPPPAVPSIVSPDDEQCIYEGPIRLRWIPSARATSYVVFLSPGPDEPPVLQVAPPTSETTVEVSPTSLQFGTDPYRWFVVALSDDYPTVDVGTTSAEGSFRLCLPARSTGLEPDATGCTSSEEFSWNAATGATSYDVFMSAGSPPGEVGGPLDREIASGIGETRVAVPTDLQPGIYRWVVYSRNAFSERAGTRVPSLVATFQVCPDPIFRRGDVSADGSTDISDAVRMLLDLFAGGPEMACRAAADVNADSSIDVADPIFLLDYLFGAGPDPAPPFPDCGVSGRASDRVFGCEESCGPL